MNRSTIIFCLSALAVMVLGIGVAVAFLYSGTGQNDKERKVKVADSDRCLTLCAVPSDAILVSTYNKASKSYADGVPMVESLHYYSGTLYRLNVLDFGKEHEAREIAQEKALGEGLYAVSEDNLLLVSDSETLLKSSQRHIVKGISVLDAAGFQNALTTVDGKNNVYIPNCHFGKLLPSLMPRPYSSYAGFLERLSQWCMFNLNTSKELISLAGTLVHDSDASDFMNVFEAMKPAAVEFSTMLPSYTLFAASMPMKELTAYVNAYKSYLDSRQKMQIYLAAQNRLGLEVSPVEMLQNWDVREVAVASFKVSSSVETVNLMKVGSPVVSELFAGTDVTTLKGYQPELHKWAYPSLLSAVFGDFYARNDESYFTYIDGWVITGSQTAVEEYVSGRALEYDLKKYMSDAGQSDLLAQHPSVFVSYFSCTEDRSELPSIFKKNMLTDLQALCGDAEYCPLVLSVSGGKKNSAVKLDLHRLTLKKTKAPAFERDTTVVVPKGPYDVKNSGTGKMNKFYQNSHNSLCLSQDGKDLWGVPFSDPLCGRAGTVDYFANGKLQILFCASDKLYLIDRLGRYVTGFPLSLGKEVLLGPDIYDFNGAKKYNIMVLHKDNTVEMYNLKGQKPASWKGITSSETIKNLPERLIVGGNTFWVVRTSIQTLIFPFYGGEPLTVFTGNQMIRPDSAVKAVDATTVDFTCYDGKVRTLKIK
ncbi:MAG: hypothetical protein IKV75_03640 [Bacteroidales bacterium]|nr:hypothetical protein [Bacteroidales bacterium]